MRTKFFYGKTGSGKTLGVVREVVRDYVLGRQIWSNMSFKLIPYYKIDLVDLLLMVSDDTLDTNNPTPKTLVLDEIHTLFDGRRSQSKPNIDFSVFISQCRKRRFNVYYTSQFISGADIRIRTLTNEIIRCIPHINKYDLGAGDASTPEPVKFEQRIFNIEQEKLRIKFVKRTQARAFYKFYDTFEVIRPVEAYA